MIRWRTQVRVPRYGGYNASRLVSHFLLLKLKYSRRHARTYQGPGGQQSDPPVHEGEQVISPMWFQQYSDTNLDELQCRFPYSGCFGRWRDSPGSQGTINRNAIIDSRHSHTNLQEFSQWPTIPQLYVDGEFIGGSDIMIEMYQSGELGEMVEKAKANQM